jgi:hypothetical protein
LAKREVRYLQRFLRVLPIICENDNFPLGGGLNGLLHARARMPATHRDHPDTRVCQPDLALSRIVRLRVFISERALYTLLFT